MANVIASTLCHIRAVQQVNWPKNKSRNSDGNKHQVNFTPWGKQDAGKNNRCHSARSTQATIAVIISLGKQIICIGNCHSAKVHDNVQGVAKPPKQTVKHIFYQYAKTV